MAYSDCVPSAIKKARIYNANRVISVISEPVRRQIGRRYRQCRDIVKTHGISGLSDRVSVVAAKWLRPTHIEMPVCRTDVLAADLSQPYSGSPPPVVLGQPIALNWVIIPAGPGSGGHTTIFRIIRYLEAHGYLNRVYFYNAYEADLQYYASVVREYYGFSGPVASVDKMTADAHGIFATSWPTAYPVFNSRCCGKRFYLVQDFEPYFYPVGTLSLLAENTYKMGFHGITVGQCFAEKLRVQFGMVLDVFEYGCDVSCYRRWPNRKRSGVVFYARRDTARRGFELGMMALEVFAQRCPDIEIHIYGDKVGRLPFRFTDHGRITPEKLDELYNHCYAGLTLSFTNVSLVAQEMLASGCIPVINDTREIRTDLKSPFVRYAAPSPHSLASALEEVVANCNFESLSQAAAASVRCITWDDAGASVSAILQRALGAGPRVGM